MKLLQDDIAEKLTREIAGGLLAMGHEVVGATLLIYNRVSESGVEAESYALAIETGVSAAKLIESSIEDLKDLQQADAAATASTSN